MPEDMPYSTLTQDERAYKIMLLRDQYGKTFAEIAKEYEMSVGRAHQIYIRTKMKQIDLYIAHVSAALGHENTSEIRKVYCDAYECYQDWVYASAYLEKKYQSILDAYRDGEPGMPKQFLKAMPPFKSRISKKTVARIVEMHEVEKASFVTIGKKLHMTPEKAKHTYRWFYHKKVLKLLEILQKKAGSDEEKEAIFRDCFKGNRSSKTRYYELLERLGERADVE